MKKSLTLYTNPMSRGRIARWMLEEVGEPYETIQLEFGPAMKQGELVALNPMGKVPVLKHGDTVVSEAAAICAYLADVFPEKKLAPPLDQRGAYYRWLFFAAGPVEAAVTAKALGLLAPSEKSGMAGYGALRRRSTRWSLQLRAANTLPAITSLPPTCTSARRSAGA